MEELPIAALEAISSGIPVVVTSTGKVVIGRKGRLYCAASSYRRDGGETLVLNQELNPK